MLNEKCPLLVRMLFEKFGGFQCAGQEPTTQEVAFAPLQGRLRDLNDLFPKGTARGSSVL